MDLAQTFIARSRYYLQIEYRTKLRAAVEALPPEGLWWRANDNSNSVGNLLLHLAGNIRQWIVAGVGKFPDGRDRDSEFALSRISASGSESRCRTRRAPNAAWIRPMYSLSAALRTRSNQPTLPSTALRRNTSDDGLNRPLRTPGRLSRS